MCDTDLVSAVMCTVLYCSKLGIPGQSFARLFPSKICTGSTPLLTYDSVQFCISMKRQGVIAHQSMYLQSCIDLQLTGLWILVL